MKIVLEKRRTFEGFTYKPGEHEVTDALGERLLATFPAVCRVDAGQEPEGDEEAMEVPELADEPGVVLLQVDATETAQSAWRTSAVRLADKHGVVSQIDATEMARTLADERGIDLLQVEGTGSGGKVTVRDVKNYVPREADDDPAPDVEDAAK